MQSNAYHDSYLNGNADLYKEVFQVLDQLGMADLKVTFQEHCIQDQTLSFVETEAELKQILKEIGIPLGRCIPIMKSWSKRYSRKERCQLSNVAMLDQSSQASVEKSDVGVQTEHEFHNMVAANYPTVIDNMTELQFISGRDYLNQFAPAAGAGFDVDEAHRNLCAPFAVPYGAQQMEPYASPHTFIPPYANDFAHNIYGAGRAYIQAPNAGVPAEAITTSNSVVDIPGPEVVGQNLRRRNHVERPLTTSPPLQTHEAGHHGLSRSVTGPKDIVDETEDRAIEQSLKHFEDMERESQHSYASALNSDAPNQSNHASYTAGADQQSQKAHPPHLAQHYSSHHDQRLQSRLSAASSSPRTQTVLKMASVRDKTDYSQFSKCDDIAVDGGVLRKSSSLQNVASQTLQAYLESIPESKEYKEAMQSRNPKNGWKAVDGKHIASGKKVPFKPIFWDSEGRMRHGVRVRGADKSEECWRHTEGKAPAGCTFAHSRLGDTLQFICVKCTCDKGINDWCMDKMKHKQYIFNLGAFKNLEGGVWKKSS